MVQERSNTPEKQLLNLIESPKAERKKIFSHYPAGGYSLKLLSPAALKGRVSFFKEKLEKWFKNQQHRPLNIKAVNNVLGLAVLILGIYCVSDFSVSLIKSKRSADLKFSSPEGSMADSGQVDSILKVASYYLGLARKRDLFKMGAKRVEAEEEQIEAPNDLASVASATQHLKLVGISWSNDPDAMIEDTKAVRTFFIKRGQMLGTVRVEAIFKDKVILSYEGEEIELR